MSDLSGRVDSLENQVIYLVQDLLQKPDLNTYSQLQTIWNQQFDTVNDNLYTLTAQLRELQALYINIVLSGLLVNNGGGTDGAGSSSGLSETFESISQNIAQYPYDLYYDTGNILTGIRYNVTSVNYIDKHLHYTSGQLVEITLTGSPVPSVSLHKYLHYSGDFITGVSYS